MATKGELMGAGALANAGGSGSVPGSGARYSSGRRRRCSHCGELKTPPELATYKHLDCKEVFEFCVECREDPEAMKSAKEAFAPYIEKRRKASGSEGNAENGASGNGKNGSKKKGSSKKAPGDAANASSFSDMRGHREKAAKGSRESARVRREARTGEKRSGSEGRRNVG